MILFFLTEFINSCLIFTFEKEAHGKLPFLKALVEKTKSKFFTSVYLKPTFTRQSTCWNFLVIPKPKTNLIGALVRQAMSICYTCKFRLPQELDHIKTILCKNCYPDSIIQADMSKATTKFSAHKIKVPQT